MGVGRNLNGRSDHDAILFQKVFGETVTVGQFEGAPVHLQFISDIKILDRVEFVVVRWR